ncbi:MAG TPA: cytochrome-c oxidase, cbb3-type subunit III [Steroidobacteraceae bacterium]|nr:cytochrome-c oxidase, cbb3-type subunit III [Steroidobacteraceae bacterium]
MSGFWSIWVIVLACLTAGLSLFMFFWAQRMRIDTVEDGTTGHVWAHGVLREAVRPLPWWWVLISAGAFLFAVFYLLLYPGFGNFPGRIGWTSQGEQQRHTAENNARLEERIAPLRELSIEQLAAHKEAVGIGHRLFQDNCAACHGPGARGNHAVGAPDLTDADWLWGGDDKTILTSILDGRQGIMPPLGGGLGVNGTNEVAAYVVSRIGTQVPADWAAAGKTRFDALCSACHGVDGRGNPALGAPNLVDDAWLYGSNIESVVAAVRDGRNGVMPAWRERLSLDEVRLITAWIKAQGQIAFVDQGTSRPLGASSATEAP